MRRLRTGLSRRGGKCAGKRLGISRIRFGLVFRGLDEKCTHNRNEISALAGELVFRQVPGKSVQGWGRAERFGVGVLVALLEAIGDGVGGISGAPTGLGFLAPGLLAVRLAAGVLAVADSVIRLEPPAADPAGPLAGIGHAGPSSAGWVGQFGRVGVGQFSRAPKLQHETQPILQILKLRLAHYCAEVELTLKRCHQPRQSLDDSGIYI